MGLNSVSLWDFYPRLNVELWLFRHMIDCFCATSISVIYTMDSVVLALRVLIPYPCITSLPSGRCFHPILSYQAISCFIFQPRLTSNLSVRLSPVTTTTLRLGFHPADIDYTPATLLGR